MPLYCENARGANHLAETPPLSRHLEQETPTKMDVSVGVMRNMSMGCALSSISVGMNESKES